MTIETDGQNKFNLIMASALICLLFGLICAFSPSYYAVYTPLANVPADSSPIAFFNGNSPTGIGNCVFVKFELAEPSLEGTYEIFSNISRFPIQSIPLYLAIWALPGIAMKRRISPLKFLITALLIVALLLSALVFFTSKNDCALTPSIRITDFKPYWPTIGLWIISCVLVFLTLVKVYKTSPKVS